MKAAHFLLLSCLFAQAGEVLVLDGTNSITKAEYIKYLCLIDSMGEEDLIRRAGSVGSNAVPWLLEILDTPNDARLQSRAMTRLGGLSPDDLRARHDVVVQRIRLGDPVMWGALDVLPGIARPGDERVVAELLYVGDRPAIKAATDTLVKIGTPAALKELETAFPVLAKQARPLPPERTQEEARRALGKKSVPETGEVVRVYEPYVRSLSNRIVTLRQKLAAASNQTTTTLGGETTRTSALTGPRATGLPGGDPAPQAATAEPASRLIRFALPAALLALAAVVFWLIRWPRQS